ncbi:unnamed protein product, partial [Closterium sp. Naga37s-1]
IAAQPRTDNSKGVKQVGVRAPTGSSPADFSRANVILSDLHTKLDALARRLPTLSADDADFEAIGHPEPEGLPLAAHPFVDALPLPEETVIRRDEPPIYQHLREQNSLQRQTQTGGSAAPNDAIADGRVMRDSVTDDAEDAEFANLVKSEEVADLAGGAAGNPDFHTKNSTDRALSGDISRQLLSELSGDMAVEASILPASRRVPTSPKYFLSAMVYNRVFRGDRLKFSSFEIWQWVAFTRLAGVEHVFWYDCAHDASERQSEALGPFIHAGYLTYLPLHHILSAAYNVFPEQNGAILHFLKEYRNASTWVLFYDVDEFIFDPRDLRAGFLFRFMRNVSLSDPAVTQVLAPNIFFVGNSEAPRSSLLFHRFTKCQHLADWRQHLQRSKPVVRVAAVEQWADMRVAPHFFPMAVGATERADPAQLRMHHYWGPRGTGFGAESRKFAEEVERDLTVQPLELPLSRMLDPGLPYLTYLEAKRRILEAADSAMRLSYTLADPFEWR